MEQITPNYQNRPPERPSGRLPEWQLWQIKMGLDNDGRPMQVGFTDADNNYKELKPGEKFEVNRHEDGGRTAILRRADSTMEILKRWPSGERYNI
jgi:hypothetical protein